MHERPAPEVESWYAAFAPLGTPDAKIAWSAAVSVMNT